MQTPGYVSLWLGRLGSAKQLKDIMRTKYSDDGDFEGSQFSRVYGLGFFNESCMEAEFLEQPSKDLRTLLRGFSYEKAIIPRFSQEVGELTDVYNTVLLLYNLRYEGDLVEWPVESGFLKFCAVISYEI